MDRHVTGYEGPFTFWSDGTVTKAIVTKSGAELFWTLPPHSVYPLPTTPPKKIAIDQAEHDDGH